MGSFKPEQRHLVIRGRAFHFVLYEGQPGRGSPKQGASPAVWYLMVEGRRCPVFACDPQRDAADTDAALIAWAEDNAVGPVVEPAVDRLTAAASVRRRANWWGPV